jgi:hypothetical protein
MHGQISELISTHTKRGKYLYQYTSVNTQFSTYNPQLRLYSVIEVFIYGDTQHPCDIQLQLKTKRHFTNAFWLLSNHSQLACVLYESAETIPEPVLFLLKREWLCPCQDSNVNSPIVHFAACVLRQILLLLLLRQIPLWPISELNAYWKIN